MGFSHQDSFARTLWTPVIIPAGPRAYLRVIPGGWKTEPPDVSTIGRLDAGIAPDAPTHQSGGDFGPTKEGYVRYWISSAMNAQRESEDLTMYFEDTGEFWMVTGSPTVAALELQTTYAATWRSKLSWLRSPATNIKNAAPERGRRFCVRGPWLTGDLPSGPVT